MTARLQSKSRVVEVRCKLARGLSPGARCHTAAIEEPIPGERARQPLSYRRLNRQPKEERDMAVNDSPSRAASSAADESKDFATTTREVATEVADRASSVAARLPEAAATTRDAVEEAARRMEAGSDQMLAVGASMSLGLALGMLVGGGNRLLVAVALIPATAMAFTLLDRYGSNRTTTPVRRPG
jgi:hypothetical protein